MAMGTTITESDIACVSSLWLKTKQPLHKKEKKKKKTKQPPSLHQTSTSSFSTKKGKKKEKRSMIKIYFYFPFFFFVQILLRSCRQTHSNPKDVSLEYCWIEQWAFAVEHNEIEKLHHSIKHDQLVNTTNS